VIRWACLAARRCMSVTFVQCNSCPSYGYAVHCASCLPLVLMLACAARHPTSYSSFLWTCSCCDVQLLSLSACRVCHLFFHMCCTLQRGVLPAFTCCYRHSFYTAALTTVQFLHCCTHHCTCVVIGVSLSFAAPPPTLTPVQFSTAHVSA
jgi:hypothetical protein